MFRDEIDRMLTPARVVVRGAAQIRMPYERALDAVRARYPGGAITALELPSEQHVALSVYVRDSGVSHEVFVDPYTARVRGSRTGETVANVIRQTHVRFYYFSWQGRVAVGVFGLTLLLSSITGLIIYGPFMKGLAFGTIRRGRLQLKTADWHKLLGILTLGFNVIIAITGAVLGLENLQRFSPAVAEAFHPRPPQEVRALRPESLDGMIPVDSALASARAVLRGVTFTRIDMPAAGLRHFRFRGAHGSQWSQQVSSDAIVETHTGRVLWSNDAREGRLVTRAYNLNEPLHFGNFGGMPVRVLYAVLGLISGILPITGFLLWTLKRRKRRAPVRAASPPIEQMQ